MSKASTRLAPIHHPHGFARGAAVSVPFVFALAYFFTDQIGAILADVHRVERWLALAALIGLTGGVVVFVMRSNRRVSKAP